MNHYCIILICSFSPQAMCRCHRKCKPKQGKFTEITMKTKIDLGIHQWSFILLRELYGECHIIASYSKQKLIFNLSGKGSFVTFGQVVDVYQPYSVAHQSIPTCLKCYYPVFSRTVWHLFDNSCRKAQLTMSESEYNNCDGEVVKLPIYSAVSTSHSYRI